MEQSQALEKLIKHYSEQFELSRDVKIAGLTVPVAASLRHRGQVAILGFSTGRLGPEACEHVFMLENDNFDDGFLSQITDLIEHAEREYVQLNTNHAYTFLSVVALVKETQKSAAALLKKYKYRRDYGKNGWVMSRIAVIQEDGESFSSKDGADLKKMIYNIIKAGED